MKVLHINTTDSGGAGIAAIRLHLALAEHEGVQSKVLVRYKNRNIPGVYKFKPSRLSAFARVVTKVLHKIHVIRHPLIIRQDDKEQILKNHFANTEAFTFSDTDTDVTQSLLYREADIIHLHWVADFLDYPSFFRNNKKPVVWTLHDMAPFTGGLHYKLIIKGLDETGKARLRQLTGFELSILKENLKIKRDALWHVDHLVIVTPSQWLMLESQHSELFSRFPHHVIRNGIDPTIFNLYDRASARAMFDLPVEKTILLFVANDLHTYRKGFAFLMRVLEQLQDDSLLLCTVGSPEFILDNVRIKHLGRITDERTLSLAYAAADAFVIPSLEDNLPNTMIESLMCGIPVIGFPVGGIAEVIKDGVNGYLSEELSVGALKQAISKFLMNRNSFDQKSISSWAHETFSVENQSQKYIQLYNEL